MGTPQQAPSFGSLMLKCGGGVSMMFGLVALVSLATGMKFEFAAAGASEGVPLTSSWPGIAILMVVGVCCLWLGTRWDAPGFVAFRRRRRWFVPVVFTFVLLPALLAAIFAMVR